VVLPHAAPAAHVWFAEQFSEKMSGVRVIDPLFLAVFEA
jgi:hypothetical protein